MSTPPPAPSTLTLKREVLTVFAASVALTAALSLAPMGGYISLLVALVFLGLPTLVVRHWRGEDPDAAGMRYGPLWPSLARGFLWGIVIFAPFALGFHVWSTHVQGRTASWDIDNYWRLPPELEGRPEGLERSDTGVFLWREGALLRTWWNGTPGLTLEIEVEEGTLALRHVQGAALERPSETHAVVRAAGARGGTAILAQGRDASLRVNLREPSGASVSPDKVVMGYASERPSELPLELELEITWLLGLLITQLFFVGLPEEYFYRGYVQPTLARIWPERGWGRGRLRLSAAVVLASVLFALGHFLIDWRITRLAVFFPSLLFGILRERSGGILAPMVFHALCNTMVEIVAVHYPV